MKDFESERRMASDLAVSQQRMWSSQIPQRAAGVALALAIMFLSGWATAQDGANPNADVIRDAAGNLYGTTTAGGGSGCGGSGCGTVFMLNKSGNETVLYSFTGIGGDGATPFAGVIQDSAGNLYGTTSAGGSSGCGGSGCGTVFMLNKSGSETVLYSFMGTGSDGAAPFAGVIRDAAGNLYGTTTAGGGSGCGGSGCGTVFMLNKSGSETVLYSFTGTGGDGATPWAGVIRDAAGNLYGTTAWGGGSSCGCGTVYMLDNSGNETVLHSFTGATDGSIPTAGLLRDKAGSLYGTTFGGDFGFGTVFKIIKTGKESVLHGFKDTFDGAFPYAGLVRDAKGNLYGATWQGGGTGNLNGTIFKLGKRHKLTVLHTFIRGSDGAGPANFGDLSRDTKGNLYGSTYDGGGDGCSGNGCGTVFKLDNAGKEIVLHRF